MGGCATKPKVETGKAPAPVTDEKVVLEAEEVLATGSNSKEIGDEEKKNEEEAVSRRRSLRNLLVNNQVAEEKDKSESSTAEKSLEKVAQVSELPNQERPPDSVEQVPTEAIGLSDGLKAELTEAGFTKLPVPDVVTSEILKLSEADTKIVTAGPETLTIETPKPSEVTNTEAFSPSAVPESESLKPSDVKKTHEAATAAAPTLETPKPSEITKTEDVPPVVEAPKSEILKPYDVTKTDNAAAPAAPKSETLESANATTTKKEDAGTLKPIESSKKKDASAETWK